jgi:hypothetical protein
MKLARAAGCNLRHGDPISKAFLAASTTLSISLYHTRQISRDRQKQGIFIYSYLCTRQISSPLLGLMTGNVFPLIALCHTLLIRIWVYLISISELVETNPGI